MMLLELEVGIQNKLASCNINWLIFHLLVGIKKKTTTTNHKTLYVYNKTYGTSNASHKFFFSKT
jgi:hypothetical protein